MHGRLGAVVREAREGACQAQDGAAVKGRAGARPQSQTRSAMADATDGQEGGYGHIFVRGKGETVE